MKRFLFFAWAMMMLTGCMKEDIDELRSQVQENTERITALEDAVAALEARLENGAMIKSVTPVSGEPGGWRIEFTEGSPASIEILNGASASAPDPGDNGVSPLIEGRTGAGGTVTLWYNITAGYPESGWTDTGVDLRGPQGPQGPQGSPGDNGEEGYPGNPGASAVSPQVRVVDSGNGRVTIQYNNTAGYPESGWTNAGDPIALDSNPRDKAAIFSIVENEATGTITITMNDSDVAAERTTFDFAMASGAVRFEWVGFNDKVTIEAGAEVQLKFVVNPSNAYVPTGEAAAIAGKWS
ncbi:MAG: hypothetical protein LBV32_08800, partial [Tannerellaceae bacterium]|nr:hypothetical protein [Tannerellaceae bacterium]